MYSKKHRFPGANGATLADGEAVQCSAVQCSAVMAKIVNHPRKTPAAKPKRINLALQGGGAHGAFT